MKSFNHNLTLSQAVQVVLVMLLCTTNVSGAKLPSCPSSPNCVSSQTTDSHWIAPFSFNGDTTVAFQRLKTLLANRPDTKVISSDEQTIQVEFHTMLGFVDDGWFLLDKSNAVIQVRSAARMGYWDLGKNRRRLEEIRQLFSQPATKTP